MILMFSKFFSIELFQKKITNVKNVSLILYFNNLSKKYIESRFGCQFSIRILKISKQFYLFI